jgi:hypothetical protein
MTLQASIDSPEKIQHFLESSHETPVFLIVYASPRAGDSLMWCGDCRRAEPFINKKFGERQEQVMMVYAGTEAE